MGIKLKAILEFTFDDYFEKNEFVRCFSGTDAYLVIHDLKCWLIDRKGEETAEERKQIIDEVIEYLELSMEERHVSLDNLD